MMPTFLRRFAGQNFIVLAHRRSGSTLLTAALGSHPRLRTGGELFNPRYYDLPTICVADKLLEGDHLSDANDLVRLAKEGFWRFDGFKILYYQLPEHYKVWDFLRGRKNLKVIHLYREDWLAAAISQVVAVKSKVFHRASKAPEIVDEPIRLEAAYLSQFHDVLSRRINHYLGLFKENSIRLTYEALTTDWDRTLREVQTFLEVPIYPLKPTMEKRTTTPLRELVVNIDELKRKLPGALELSA